MSGSTVGSGGFLRVEVRTRPDRPDAEGARLAAEAERLLGHPLAVRVLRGYSLRFAGDAPDPESRRQIIHRILVDPVLQEATVLAEDDPVPQDQPGHRVDVVRKPGVMDPVAASVRRAFAALGDPLAAVRTYQVTLFPPEVDPGELEVLAMDLLANPLIEEVRIDPQVAVPPDPPGHAAPYVVRDVPLRDADDQTLERISREGLLALDQEEMRTIQAWYREQGREPTDVELETLAQTWSEHCKHKTLTASVELPDRHYDNLLKDTIFDATRTIDREDCLSVFQDNAGVVAFDDETAVSFKVETHNHPSALEPYGGAGTGIGGVIRDTMGTGLGARPVLSTDVFCVGPLELGHDDLPPGTLPPRRILQGVVAGVRDYGNRMGIPTANGAVFVHRDYRANPLVFCGNVGLIPRDKVHKAARPGDRVFVLGGRTGRDGIHGATFSSEGLHADSEEEAGGAVQIGNAIEEKRLLDACLDARDRGLFTAITDCGAGGLSSAVGEMGEETGADVELSRVPLKYEGLTPGEIWISEAQERMVLAVPPDHAAELQEVCRVHQVEATDLGCFTDDRRLHLTWDGRTVLELSMAFLHDGLPRTRRKARDPALPATAPDVSPVTRPGATLHALLRHPNITSKEAICRQYDHEVLAGSVVKPLSGPGGFGPADGCVTAPRLGSRRGIVVGCGMSPTTGALDPYRMALLAIDEAVRNVVASGGRFDLVTLLDNFAWPSVQDEESLGAVVRACEACRDAALAWRTPFISGKDSLNNQLKTGDGVIRIPPTLLISALTQIDDVTGAVTMDLKRPEHALYLVGTTGAALGGAHLLEVHPGHGGAPPLVDLEAARAVHQAVAAALAAGSVRACHDLAEGGLAVALAEMALAGGVGAHVDLHAVPVEGDGVERDARLFAETPSRYLLEVAPEQEETLLRQLAHVPHARIGETLGAPHVVFEDRGTTVLQEDLEPLTASFRTGLGI